VLVTVSLQRLVRADVMSDDAGADLPGAKTDVAFVSTLRQLLRLELLLSEVKKLVQEVVMPLGMRGSEEVLVALAAEPVVLVAGD